MPYGASLRRALVGGIEVEVWDVVVLGDGPAGLAAAANAASEGANVLLMTAEALGRRDPRMADGLAAAIDESTNRGHREDTIRSGAFLSDQDIVASVTASAVREAIFSSAAASSSAATCEDCLRCVDCPVTASRASSVGRRRFA